MTNQNNTSRDVHMLVRLPRRAALWRFWADRDVPRVHRLQEQFVRERSVKHDIRYMHYNIYNMYGTCNPICTILVIYIYGVSFKDADAVVHHNANKHKKNADTNST